MSATILLDLPYIAAGQAQKHVTHNEALRRLDALVLLAVIDRDLAAPPGGAADGERYLVADAAAGAWAGHAGEIAALQDGAWAFLAPREGWLAFVADEKRLVVHAAGAWRTWPVDDALPRLGIGAAPDGVNRLAVASQASLFSHAGAGHQLKINKAAAGDTASVVLQSGFSGRAEIGLAGDDRLRVKASADGILWRDALVVDGATGNIGMGAAPANARLEVDGAVKVKSYTVAAAPSAAAQGPGAIVFLSNEAGGAVLAFSDGLVWRRVTDRAAAS